MNYFREIAIIILIAALCFSTWQCDRAKGKLNELDAGKKRMENISSVQAGRKGIQGRESGLYPAVEKAVNEIGAKRAGIKREESRLVTPTTKEIAHEVEITTQGDINRLADLFRADGYTCSVIER